MIQISKKGTGLFVTIITSCKKLGKRIVFDLLFNDSIGRITLLQ